jgi:hypothetical protein
MSDIERPSSNSRTGLTATITGLIVSVSALFTADLSPEVKTIVPIIAGILSPFIAAGIYRLQRRVEQDPKLTDFLSAYESDLKYQKNALKDQSLSAEAKAELEKRYSNTVLKMSTAHQDFRTAALQFETKELPEAGE